MDALYYWEALLGAEIKKMSGYEFEAEILMEKMVWGLAEAKINQFYLK